MPMIVILKVQKHYISYMNFRYFIIWRTHTKSSFMLCGHTCLYLNPRGWAFSVDLRLFKDFKYSQTQTGNSLRVVFTSPAAAWFLDNVGMSCLPGSINRQFHSFRSNDNDSHIHQDRVVCSEGRETL